MKTFIFTTFAVLAFLTLQCQSQAHSHSKQKKTLKKTGKAVTMVLTSSAFEEGAMIPSKFTCDGENVSPALSWSGAPAGVKTFALIADDPDAPMGTWVHWVIFNIPDSVNHLAEAVPAVPTLPNGAVQGKNDFRKIGYGGPCPLGGVHRYFFKLYALDTRLALQPGSTKAELLKAMEGHILAQAQLMGRYSRK